MIPTKAKVASATMLLLLLVAFIVSGASAEQPTSTPVADAPSNEIAIPIASAVPILGPPNDDSRYRPQALWVEWKFGHCSAAIESGRFHSAEVRQVRQGIVVTLKVHRASRTAAHEAYNPYDPKQPQCSVLTSSDFQIIPLPAPIGKRRLLDGWCKDPSKCPIDPGYLPKARHDLDSLVVTSG